MITKQAMKGIVSVRIGEDRERIILNLVDQNIYKNISEFVIEAIDEKLDPEINFKRRKNRILYDIRNNPDLRQELVKIFKELRDQ